MELEDEDEDEDEDDEDEDGEGSAVSHSGFAAESDFESEEEFSQQRRRRDEASTDLGEVIEIAKAASQWAHVENDSESGSESMTSFSEERSQLQLQSPQRRNYLQAVEEAANEECSVDDRICSHTESKPESGSSEDKPILDRHRARRIERAIQYQLADERGAIEEAGQMSDGDTSTPFPSRASPLPSQDEPVGENQDLKEARPMAQRASERGSSIYSALFAASSIEREPDPESDILEEAETLEATESNNSNQAANAFLSTIPFPSIDRQSAGANETPRQTETPEAREPITISKKAK